MALPCKPGFFAAVIMAAGSIAHADPAPHQPARVYALVAAVGNRFSVVHEEQSVGSHISPYRRATYEVGGNMINRLVLQGLDAAVARAEPESRRVYLSTTPGRGGIEHVVAELAKLDRANWDRILVAMPAYRSQSKERLASKLEGVGLFTQPQCQSDTGTRGRIGSCDHGFRPPSGPEALTPEGKAIAANSFVAPFSFVEVWVLDPKTLAVLDRTTTYSHRKLADEKASLSGVIDGSRPEFLARQIVELVTRSVDEAVNGTALGTVEVREKGPVSPGR